MIEIARCPEESGIFQKDIAANQEISNKYLDHIIHALKVAGLVRKYGHKGGYVLSRPASEITVLDINSAFEPGICIIECLECLVKCPRELECSTKTFWQDLNKLINDHFRNSTLADLVAADKTRNE